MLKIDTGYEKALINYDPKKYKTKAGAAKGLYKALVKYAQEIGYTKEQAEREVIIKSPKEDKFIGDQPCWWICWEGFIYDWAISASFQISGNWGYTEPYYGFDLCFWD
tara:strand:+ start:111 stop:434 length:324 start_codon:yes stop_codon:yes gene_type:complete